MRKTFLCLVPVALLACSADGEDAPSTDLEWVAPDTSDVVRTGDPVELTVKGDHARGVRFAIDGRDVFSCDPASDPDEDCHVAGLWRFTTVIDSVGPHVLRATRDDGSFVETKVEVLGADPTEDAPWMHEPPPSADDAAPDVALAPPSIEAGGEAELGGRGYLDPDRGYHDVFGGVSWAVVSQRVRVVHAPSGSVATVASCMRRYGASIRHWADHFRLSRGSVVATAITESSCTNPRGSSDGLSSGPMQVTGSTCAALTGLSSSTCRWRMHAHPDFSFYVGAKYMASSYQVRQHRHDPPKIAAAYNAGSIRRYYGNRWHMLVTGNHLERWVGAYDAYRSWEAQHMTARMLVEPRAGERAFEGESVPLASLLPPSAADGTVVFVGDWAGRDGHFYERIAGGAWLPTDVDTVDP